MLRPRSTRARVVRTDAPSIAANSFASLTIGKSSRLKQSLRVSERCFDRAASLRRGRGAADRRCHLPWGTYRRDRASRCL